MVDVLRGTLTIPTLCLSREVAVINASGLFEGIFSDRDFRFELGIVLSNKIRNANHGSLMANLLPLVIFCSTFQW